MGFHDSCLQKRPHPRRHGLPDGHTGKIENPVVFILGKFANHIRFYHIEKFFQPITNSQSNIIREEQQCCEEDRRLQELQQEWQRHLLRRPRKFRGNQWTTRRSRRRKIMNFDQSEFTFFDYLLIQKMLVHYFKSTL